MSNPFVLDTQITSNATKELLQYTDVQDGFLYTSRAEANPFLNKTQRQITNVVRDARTQVPKDPYQFGAKNVKLQIDKMVSVLGDLQIHVTLSPLVNASGEAIAPNKRLSWVNGLGFYLFDSIRIVTDSNIPVQELQPIDHLLTAELFDEDTSDTDCPLDVGYWTHNRQRMIQKVSKDAWTLQIPLKLFWRGKYGDYICPKAVGTDQFHLVFDIAKLEDLIAYAGWTQPVVPQATITDLKIVQEIFHLSEAEEALARSARWSIMYREFIKDENTFVNNAPEVNKIISYTQPISMLLLTCQSPEDIAMSNVNRRFNCSEPISQVTLQLNNKPRWDLKPYYMRQHFWKTLFNSEPDMAVYLIPFAVDPQAPFPTGSHNWNRILNSNLIIKFKQPWTGKLNIYAVTYNFATLTADGKLRKSFY